MFDFKSALKDSLQIVTDRFKKADADVREFADALGAAMNSASGEALQMMLVDDQIHNGVVYRIVVDHKTEGASDAEGCLRSVAAFRVTVKGYPVEAGAFNGCCFDAEKQIESKGELEAYFAGLAANSDSPLVLKAATLMALHGREKSATLEPSWLARLATLDSTPMDDDDDDDMIDNVPF